MTTSSVSRRCSVLAAALCAMAPAPKIAAQQLGDPTELHPLSARLDFESMPVGALPGPLTVGEATFSSVNGLGVGSMTAFGAHGGVGCDHALQAAPTGAVPAPSYETMRVTFSSPIREFGFAWLDPNFVGNQVEAYDASNALIATVVPTLVPTGGCCGDYVGYRHTSATITRLEIITPAPNDVYLIDDFRFYPSAIGPTPGFGSSCAGTGGASPDLVLAGCNHPGGNIRFALSDGRANAGAGILFGSGSTALSLGGACNLWVSGLVPAVLPVPLDASGSGEISIAIPPLLSTPATFLCQGVVIDPRLRLGPRSHHDQRSGVDDRVR